MKNRKNSFQNDEVLMLAILLPFALFLLILPFAAGFSAYDLYVKEGFSSNFWGIIFLLFVSVTVFPLIIFSGKKAPAKSRRRR